VHRGRAERRGHRAGGGVLCWEEGLLFVVFLVWSSAHSEEEKRS